MSRLDFQRTARNAVGIEPMRYPAMMGHNKLNTGAGRLDG
jgi:hypothetical protein